MQTSPPPPPPLCLATDADGDGVSSCYGDDCDDNDPNKQYGCSAQTTLPPDLNHGAPVGSCGEDPAFAGNPINIITGNKYEFQEDLRLPTPHHGGLTFSRAYNSQSSGDPATTLGHGWTHTYAISLATGITIRRANDVDAPHIQVVDATGKAFYFTKSSDSRWDGTFHEKSFIAVEDIGGYTWYRQDGFKYSFDGQGRLRWIDDPSGNRQALTYTSADFTVTDGSSSRTLTFHYKDNTTLLDHITGPLASDMNQEGASQVPDALLVSYGYDNNDNLTSVTYADGSGFIYEYNDANEAAPKHHLTAKKDIQTRLISSWEYDADGRAFKATTRDDHDVTITYPTAADPTTRVADAYGKPRIYTITQKEGLFPRVDAVAGESGCQECLQGRPVSYSYDQDLRVTEEHYANGRIDTYQDFDATGNPQTVILAAGSDEALTIKYTYHPALGTPFTMTLPSVVKGDGSTKTTWDYDDPQTTGNTDTPNERPTTLVHRLIEEGFTKDTNGAVVPVPFTYTTTYQYNAKGQLTSIDGPLANDTVTLAYSDSDTGNLTGITQPLSGPITFANYDSAGNPWQMTDANG